MAMNICKPIDDACSVHGDSDDGRGMMRPITRNWVVMTVVAMATLSMHAARGEAAPESSEGETPPSQAQREQSGRQNRIIEEVVVTVQRREQRLTDVPVAVSALGGDELAARNIGNVEDLQFNLPSTQVGERLGSGVITIRGAGFDILSPGTVSSTAVHQDGLFIARPPAQLASFFDVERVEVARGPQGTLYGRNATGGAVNIVSRKPTDTLSAYLEGTVGNFNTLNVEGALGGPFIPGVLHGRIAFKTEDHDGFGRNVFRQDQDVDDSNRQSVRGILDYFPRDDLMVRLIANYHREDDHGGGFKFNGAANDNVTPFGLLEPQNAPPLVADPSKLRGPGSASVDDLRDVNNDTQPVTKKDIYSFQGRVEWDITDNISLTSITGHMGVESFFLSDLDSTASFIFPLTREEDSKQWTQEVRLSGSFGRGGQWVAGGFLFYEDNDAFGRSPQPRGSNVFTGVFDQFGNLETKSAAIFGDATIPVTDRLALLLGARWSVEEVEVEESFEFPPVVSVDQRKDSIDFTQFNPRVGFQVDVTEDAMLFYTYSQGFKSGGFVPGGLQPGFEEEEAFAHEAGFKGSFAGGRVAVNLSGFRQRFEDLQVSKVVAETAVIENAAQAISKGAEVELDARISENVTFRFGGSWLDAEFDEFESINPVQPELGIQSFKGNDLPNAPNFSLSTAMGYMHSFLGGSSLAYSVEYIWQDEMWFETFNEEPQRQDSYDRWNLFVDWESVDGSWSVGGFVRNLEDEDHRSSGFAASSLVGSPSQVSLLAPRTYGVKLRFNY